MTRCCTEPESPIAKLLPARLKPAPRPRFPFPDIDRFGGLPKARQRRDVARIYTSGNSEDYVTWCVFTLLRRLPPGEWWPQLLELAGIVGDLPGTDDPPRTELWRTVPSPPAYERASRSRMLASPDPAWTARARDPRSVEGETEVDVALEGASYLIFAEAKLHSDISPRTTYDPSRDQVVRNIDCLLEQAGDRQPLFWMFVKDLDPHRAYRETLARYRADPGRVATLLPHREPGLVAQVVGSVTVLLWSDLLPLVAVAPGDDTAAIVAELTRRAGRR